jgi:hypothetical protein
MCVLPWASDADGPFFASILVACVDHDCHAASSEWCATADGAVSVLDVCSNLLLLRLGPPVDEARLTFAWLRVFIRIMIAKLRA